MKKQVALFTALSLACAMPALTGVPGVGFTASAQAAQTTVTGTVTDAQGEPLVGVSVMVKGTQKGGQTDIDGKFSVVGRPGQTLVLSYVGYRTKEVTAAPTPMAIVMESTDTQLNEVVVTALGIKKDKKSLGYAIDELNADELMQNKSANAINSLSGKIAGVNVTQSSGAAGAGAQIILRGGTSGNESIDNQPLFVVDGIIYDNSSSVGGNSAFDGSSNAAVTTSNRVMDINPEDIESMSVLKGPAASALYGSRAANGVILITTKKGKAGNVEVNLSAKFITSWVKDVPEAQTTYKRGYMKDNYDGDHLVSTTYDDFAYSSWGEKYAAGDKVYDNNINDFFRNGNIWDTNVSVAAGNENGNFYLSGSYFDQTGVIPTTGYTKTTFRFNGEQKWRMFTFGANAAYSEARTDRALTSGGLWGSSGDGAMSRVYGFGTTDDMAHYLNEDGSRYRMFGDRLDAWDESDNPYYIVNKNKIHDKTTRFTGSFNIKADITDWWWIQYRMGVDNYTTDYDKLIPAGGVVKQDWEDGMMSLNTTRYNYVTTNLMTNFNKTFGDFGFNLLVGTSTDNTHIKQNGLMAIHFQVPDFYSFGNASKENTTPRIYESRKRLVALYGELRADWQNTLFLTVTGRNDWTSTLPKANRSYFYPSVSGAVVFTEFLQRRGLMSSDSPLTFGKIRASWAKVGKDTSPYVTATTLWEVQKYLGGFTAIGDSWERGNPYLKPEMTKSTELGLELRFFQNRLKLDYAYYTNDSYNQILSPRGAQSTGYIFCSMNAGNVLNKGMELSISGTPIVTKDWEWETGINLAGNRGKLEGLIEGMDIMYVTDVQYGQAKAASFSGGNFMAIAGSKWKHVKYIAPYTERELAEFKLKGEQQYQEALKENDRRNHNNKFVGEIIVDPKTGIPDKSDATNYEVGNREPKLQGGWNNTLRYKNFTFNMLWEFRIGGHVFNGTQWLMDQNGTSKFSAAIRQQDLTTPAGGIYNADGYYERHPEYAQTYSPDGIYNYGGVEKSGQLIIKDYYQNYYPYETTNYITKVNSLRLRNISLSYDMPRNLLAKTKCIKRAVLTATATNLLLFTNYKGDPEAAASGAGVGGSSSVGFDYCGVPSTASFAFGINLTF